MKRLGQICSLLLFALFAIAIHAPAQLSPPASAPSSAPSELATLPPPSAPLPLGMTLLFDGKTLDGWQQIPPDSWVARNGVIASRGVGRGVIYTTSSYDRYRIIFDMRHVYGNKDHQACVLIFCTAPVARRKTLDALGGIQFQVPNGGHWDYRKGHNNGGKGEFTQLPHQKFDVRQWSRVEILIDSTNGTARMAV